MNITVEKRGLYQYGLLAKLKQSFMALLFLLTLSISFQAVASERYMPDKYHAGLQRVEVKDKQLLLTYKLVIGSDYKNIIQADIEIDISTHDSINQNPPPDYPIHKSVSTKLADWQAADGRFYEAFEYTVPFKAEEGAFVINHKLDFKDEEGKEIRQEKLFHSVIVMNELVAWGSSTYYTIDGLISAYSQEVIRKQDPEFFIKQSLIGSNLIKESEKDGKEGYQSKSLDSYRKEYSKFINTEHAVQSAVKEEYYRRFLSPQK